MNWLDSLSSFAESAGNIYGSIKGTNTKAAVATTQATEAKASNKNLMLIGGGVIVAILAVVFLMRSK